MTTKSGARSAHSPTRKSRVREASFSSSIFIASKYAQRERLRQAVCPDAFAYAVGEVQILETAPAELDEVTNPLAEYGIDKIAFPDPPRSDAESFLHAHSVKDGTEANGVGIGITRHARLPDEVASQ